MDAMDWLWQTCVVKPWIAYESAAILSLIFGAVILIWPLRAGISIAPIVFGAFIIGAACWFNVKAQRLRRDHK